MDVIAYAGEKVGSVNVSIGPQFLNLFSEHLYSSPNKAFEELVSNSWDAGAQRVYIQIPDNLDDENAAVWVLDDGASMDADGFKALWSVATSTKRSAPPEHNRKPIGKFGVGKLATYLLANQLTYVCKAADGVLRAVSMDYRQIDSFKGALHIQPLPLAVRELDDAALNEILAMLPRKEQIENLISTKLSASRIDQGSYDEFNSPETEPINEQNTWTLAILSSLKSKGRHLQSGWIRRLLRSALPLGNTISIYFNGERVSSGKSSIPVQKEWILGKDAQIAQVELPSGEIVNVVEKATPTPHIFIDGIGRITGRVRLFEDKISGGRSDEIEVSNGVFVNIRGRVIKPEDPYFGLSNLSHSVWARFRATVRADGLDSALSVNRESVSDSRELQIIRAVLMKLFNKARSEHDASAAASWPNVGDVLVEKWGLVPFQPLQRVVREGLQSKAESPEFIGMPAKTDFDQVSKDWLRETAADPGELITDVVIEDAKPSDKLVRYDVKTRRVIVNRAHPFSQEHGESNEQLLVLRDTALVDLLTDAFMADLGIEQIQLEEIRNYKDRAFRLVAQVRRRSAAQIASMLNGATSHVKGLERIVGDALEHLGYSVQRLGASGEPEGVARAVLSPDGDAGSHAYIFTYDAKSTVNGKVKTGNVGVAGLARHRDNYNANYSLVVAPEFETGALEQECIANNVTPIRANDLAQLVLLTVGFGPLSLKELRKMFEIHEPGKVTAWVQALKEKLEINQPLSLSILITSLATLMLDNPQRPDVLDCSLISEKCRELLKHKTSPTRNDVRSALTGLSLMAPNVISVSGYEVLLSAPADKLRDTILKQLSAIPDNLRYGIARTRN